MIECLWLQCGILCLVYEVVSMSYLYFIKVNKGLNDPSKY